MTGEMGLEASLVLDVASPGAAWAAWVAALEAATLAAAALEAAAPVAAREAPTLEAATLEAAAREAATLEAAAREAAACRGGGSASSTHEIEHGRTWLG